MGRSKALIEKALRIDGLSYYARVTTYTDPTHFKADDLASWGDDFFKDWFVYVVRDAGGAGAAPQDELVKITDYTSSDGTFAHVAFTTPLAITDEVLIVHKSVAAAIACGGGVNTGGISIWDSFEYPSDASLNAKWSGTSVTLTRSLTAFYEHYSMQAVVAGAGGEVHRNFAVPQDIGALRNISVSAQCDNAGDTFQFTLYDSSGNYSFWTQTITLVNTWYTFDIDPHSTPTGDGGTPVDLDDIVQMRFAALTDTTTYLFDLIMLESLMSSIIGLGYDGLSDAVGTTSSVRGHLLDVQNTVDPTLNLVNAILTLTETGGTLTTTGAVQTVYINNAPAGVFVPRTMIMDFSNHAVADTIVIRSYYRISSGGGWIKDDEETITGVRDPALVTINFEPNRFGYYVSVEKTAGANHDYLWEILYKA